MKNNWTIQDKPIQDLKKLSEEDFKKIKENIQIDIDKDIFERYEWDWEFKQAVDRMVENKKHGNSNRM